MAIDVVCGMNVSEETDIVSTFRGKTYYFCREECREQFERNPIKYTR